MISMISMFFFFSFSFLLLAQIYSLPTVENAKRHCRTRAGVHDTSSFCFFFRCVLNVLFCAVYRSSTCTYIWGALNDDFMAEKTPLYCISYIIFSLGYVRVKFCVVHVFCCARPNEWFLHPLNFGLAPRGVCSTHGPRTFSLYVV